MSSLSKRTISVHGGEKMKILRKAAGAWKGTVLDDDKFWKEVLQRKSRKSAIGLRRNFFDPKHFKRVEGLEVLGLKL